MKKSFVAFVLFESFVLSTSSSAVAGGKPSNPKHKRPTHSARYYGHPGACSSEDYRRAERAGGGCETNDSLGLGGAMPIGVRCNCY